MFGGIAPPLNASVRHAGASTLIRSVGSAALAGAVGGAGLTLMQWLLPQLIAEGPARHYTQTAIFLAFLVIPLYLWVIELPPQRSVIPPVDPTQDPQGQWFARVATRMLAYAVVVAATYAVLALIVLNERPEFH
jgi:hypothetical protein